MIKAAIFDWGGVIALNPGGGWLNILADKLGISLEELLTHWRAAGYSDLSKGMINVEEFWSRFEKSYGRDLPQDKDEIWSQGSALTPIPEMLTFVEELKQRGLKVAILSNTVPPMSKLTRASNLYELFDPVVLSDEIGMVKPDNEIYEYTLSKLGVEGSECIFIDDLPRNLDAAQKQGMHTILATNNTQNIISDIRELLSNQVMKF